MVRANSMDVILPARVAQRRLEVQRHAAQVGVSSHAAMTFGRARQEDRFTARSADETTASATARAESGHLPHAE
jgi:hypothetical protein